MALQTDGRPCIVEMDSSEAVSMIQEEKLNRSSAAFLVTEIKELLCNAPSVKLVVISREINSVSHLLTNIGRTQSRTMTWSMSGPEDVVALAHQDLSPDG
jgi:hypothetical protein